MDTGQPAAEKSEALAGRMQLEISFHQQDEASVTLDAHGSAEARQFGEIVLFNCLCLRQMHNLGSAPASRELAESLLVLGERSEPAGQGKLGPVARLVDYQGTAAKKRFIASLSFGPQRARFLLHPKGFGILGRGVNWYAPQSVLVLFAHLRTARLQDNAWQRCLLGAATLCGRAFLEGTVTTASQPGLSLKIAHCILQTDFET